MIITLRRQRVAIAPEYYSTLKAFHPLLIDCSAKYHSITSSIHVFTFDPPGRVTIQARKLEASGYWDEFHYRVQHRRVSLPWFD